MLRKIMRFVSAALTVTMVAMSPVTAFAGEMNEPAEDAAPAVTDELTEPEDTKIPADEDAAEEAATAQTGNASYEVTTAEEVEQLIADLKALYLTAIGQEELQGEPALTYTEGEDGTYTVELSITGMQEAAEPEIEWYGYDETGYTLTGLSGDALAGLYIQISAEGFYGTITVTPEFPETPEIAVTTGKNSVRVFWNRITGDAVNPAPVPRQMARNLYDGDLQNCRGTLSYGVG